MLQPMTNALHCGRLHIKFRQASQMYEFAHHSSPQCQLERMVLCRYGKRFQAAPLLCQALTVSARQPSSAAPKRVVTAPATLCSARPISSLPQPQTWRCNASRHPSPLSSQPHSALWMPHVSAAGLACEHSRQLRRFGIVPEAQRAAGPAAKHSVPWWRWLLGQALRLLFTALVSVAAATAVAPWVLSTSPGRQALVRIANHFVPRGRVQIEELQVSWRRPLRLAGLTVTTSETGGETSGGTAGEAEVLEVASVTTTRGLWAMATGKPFDLLVSEPHIDLTPGPDGEPRVLEVLQPRREARQEPPADTASQAPQEGKRQSFLGAWGLVPASDSDSESVAASELATEMVQLTADARALNGHLYVADGSMLVTDEISEALGEHLHLTALLGHTALRAEADSLDSDITWASTPPNQAPTPKQAPDTPPAAAASRGGSKAGGGLLGRLFRRSEKPFLALVSSERLSAEAKGWLWPGGARLYEPVTASLEFTPALAKSALGRINPLLRDVVELRQRQRIALTAAPRDLQWPAEATELHIEPLRLVLGRGSLVTKAIQYLNLSGRSLGSLDQLEAWTSVIRADVIGRERVVSRRLDLLVHGGNPATGVHLAMWGETDLRTRRLDFVLGIPADALAVTRGIPGLPRDFVFPVRVTGTADHPQVDWQGALRELSVLLMRHRALAGPGSGTLADSILRGAVRSLGELAGAQEHSAIPIPPPLGPLPWDEPSRGPPQEGFTLKS